MDISVFLADNWEYVALAILIIDKAVALSPMKADDMIWTSIKKAVMKLAGKDKSWLVHLEYYKSLLKNL